jgi:hypothetical protein
MVTKIKEETYEEPFDAIAGYTDDDIGWDCSLTEEGTPELPTRRPLLVDAAKNDVGATKDVSFALKTLDEELSKPGAFVVAVSVLVELAYRGDAGPPGSEAVRVRYRVMFIVTVLSWSPYVEEADSGSVTVATMRVVRVCVIVVSLSLDIDDSCPAGPAELVGCADSAVCDDL